jgi:hypothetical protein
MNDQQGISVKIFLGYLRNGEINMYLNQCSRWKEDKLLKNEKLIEVQFQTREYIGKFIESSISYPELKNKEQEIDREMQIYCPKLEIAKHSLMIFPLIFLA